MQSVEIQRPTIAGGVRVLPGQIVSLTDTDAMTLVAMGKAVPVSGAPVADNREKEAAQKISKRAATDAPGKAKK
jgi:hypothetical protein